MKYEFTGATFTAGSVTLKRIRLVKDLMGYSKGTLGGWIESEDNLSQEETCWVAGDALVYGKARVSETALVYGDARVYGSAQVSGDAWVSGGAQVYGSAQVSGGAVVSGNAKVHGSAQVTGRPKIYGHACIFGSAQVTDSVMVSGEACVYDSAKVYGRALIQDSALVRGEAKVGNVAVIGDHAELKGSAIVDGIEDYIYIGLAISSGRPTTAFKSANGIQVVTGCFSGSLQEFEAAIQETHKKNPAARKQYEAFVALIKAHFEACSYIT